MEELIQAITTKLMANTALRAVLTQADCAPGFKMFHDTAPEEARFPYVVFYLISNVEDNCFDAASNSQDNLVQFSIFSGKKDISEIKDIRGKLRTALNRQTLTYSTHTAAGACVRTSGTGPTRTDDGWTATEDYRIWFNV